MKAFVVNTGILSAIGNNTEETRFSLREGRTGLKILKGFPGLYKDYIGGQVFYTNDSLREKFSLDPCWMTNRASLLAMEAASQAMRGIEPEPGIRTGLIFGASNVSLELDGALIRRVAESNLKCEVEFTELHGPGFGTDLIAERFQASHYTATIATACSTSANAIVMGGRLIRAGILDRVLVGGADSLAEYTIKGFDALQLYDTEKCRSFDINRKGLNLGEGAAFLVLESEALVDRLKREPLAELAGWANTCDAYHITASSPDGRGARNAMLEALQQAGTLPAAVDMVNAHGTGTPNNDLSEWNALQVTFGKQVPLFSSTKSYTGHTLAAAGAIEAVFTLLSMQENLVFPGLHIKDPLDGTDACSVRIQTKKNIKTAISNSFGFGGNCTSLVFKT